MNTSHEGDERRHCPPAQPMFEALEPRLLLSGSLLGMNLGGDGAPGGGIILADAYEVDDTAGAASTITPDGTPQNHSIHVSADVDWVKFTLAVESDVTIETDGVAGDTEMWLYGPNSSTALIAYNDDADGFFSRITRAGAQALPAGGYYVKVAEYDSDDTIDSYTITVTIAANDPGWHFILVGDFDGNGFDDFASRHANGNWYVGLSDGTDFAAKANWGRWSSDLTYSDVRVGDFTGDGKDDIAGRDELGRWIVNVSTGTGFNKSVWDRWSPALTWSDVLVGDFDGDGKDDLAGRDNLGRWVVGVSAGTGFTKSVWRRWSTSLTYSNVQVGNFDGDSRDDIAGMDNTNRWFVGLARWFVRGRFTHSVWGRMPSDTTWQDVRVGDFNGDGADDIAGRRADDGRWLVAESTTNGWTYHEFTYSYWGQWNTARTWAGVLVGDFNDDGRDDLFGTEDQGRWIVGVAKATDNFQSSTWDRWLTGEPWHAIAVGDFNGDGKSDVLGRFDVDRWCVAVSDGSQFDRDFFTRWM
jgi:hypothetical protein